jgi:hypothetical protein
LFIADSIAAADMPTLFTDFRVSDCLTASKHAWISISVSSIAHLYSFLIITYELANVKRIRCMRGSFMKKTHRKSWSTNDPAMAMITGSDKV